VCVVEGFGWMMIDLWCGMWVVESLGLMMID